MHREENIPLKLENLMEKDSHCLRVAHLSDPHFSQITYQPSQLFSKRLIGNLNLLLFRKRNYQTDHLWHLPSLLKTMNIEALFITGDFSSTSLDAEFAMGKQLVEAFRERLLPTYVLPGNHDCYTHEAQRLKRYYHFFPSEGLLEKRVEHFKLGKGWWYIALDCTLATPLFDAYGDFYEKTEVYLEQVLKMIPASDRVIVGNHFPLFSEGKPRRELKRADALQKLLKAYPQVKLYLHGHDHAHYVIDRQEEGYPLVINSGSCAHRPDGTFYTINLFDKRCLIQRFILHNEKSTFSWVVDWEKYYIIT